MPPSSKNVRKRAQYLKDLEEIFTKALANKNFASAVKAKELQAREWEKDLKAPQHSPRLKNLTLQDLEALLKELEDMGVSE